MSKENHIGNYNCITDRYTHTSSTHKSCLIKIIWRLTNGKEPRAAQVIGCTFHARACRYINERDKKEEQKNSTLPSKLNLSMRGLSMRAARRCALPAHHGRLFFVSLLCYAAWRWDSHACQFIYIFFFSTASTAGRVGNLTTVRAREYEECITGTGASKAAFPGYDARCDRREQWKWICLSFCVWKFWAARRQRGMLPQKRQRNE